MLGYVTRTDRYIVLEARGGPLSRSFVAKLKKWLCALSAGTNSGFTVRPGGIPLRSPEEERPLAVPSLSELSRPRGMKVPPYFRVKFVMARTPGLKREIQVKGTSMWPKEGKGSELSTYT